MTKLTTRTNTCVGCHREFVVLEWEEGEEAPLYCSTDCAENHSIFKEEQSVGGK